MTTYKLTFTSKETGIQKTDRFSEATESAAKKAFRECYRHADYTIDSIEIIEENVQATKQQERDALEQIKAILGTLGENSYIATALDGCLEIAEWNIDCDGGDSLKERLEIAEEKLRSEIAENQATKNDFGKIHAENESMKKIRDTLINQNKETADKTAELLQKLEATQSRAEKAEVEVIQLKAKLYDYISAGA